MVLDEDAIPELDAEEPPSPSEPGRVESEELQPKIKTAINTKNLRMARSEKILYFRCCQGSFVGRSEVPSTWIR